MNTRPTPAGHPRLRVLLTCRAYTGHFLPMVPVARALVAAGHTVACASGPNVEMDAEREGLVFFAAGPDQLTNDERAHLFPEIASLTPSQIRPFFFGRVFTAYELPLRAPALDSVIERWRPDLVIHEVAEFAAPLVATGRGLPYATHSYGPVLADEAIAAAARGAQPSWEGAGLRPHPRAGLWEHLYLDICPPTLQRGEAAGAPAVQQVRPVERVLTEKHRARPLLYVTLGTVYNTQPALFRTILDGLVDEPVDVLVTVGRQGDPAALGPQPANVRVERFVPQSEVLASCAAVITHGGAGTTLGALAFGRPILFVPQGADQFANSEQVVACGAGLRLLPGEISSDAIRRTSRRLVQELSYRNGARRIAREIAAMPSADDSLLSIEDLVDH